MSKKPKSASTKAPVAVSQPPRKTADLSKWLPAVLVLVVLACYWVPMTSPGTSILWDAADYYQVVQNYLSEELHAGHVPFWTPFVWSGFPFLADPQVGAWYPLNWPFFLFGVSPHALQVEHFLHALLACFGAFLLARRLFGQNAAAVFSGLCYGLCGYFAGHSSHTTMIQAAAWLPWMLWLFLRALDANTAVNTVLGILVAGHMILAGHFQTILYSFLALALFATSRMIAEPRRWLRISTVALAIPCGGTLLSAIGTAPGLELVAHSIRAGISGVTRTEGFVPPQSLLTLLYPDYYGVISGNYHGPADITQFYFYAGLLLLPMAILGLRNRAVRWSGILLIVPCLWYAAGYSGGLYYLVARLPGFSSIRAPVNIWFVPAIGLALLSGAGFVRVTEKWRLRWLPVALLAFAGVDLWYWNSANNPLAYGRTSYQEVYGTREDLFERAVAATQPPLSRFDGPEANATFGPMSHALAKRVEATYGYGPLKIGPYRDFVEAMQANPKLKNDLNVTRYLDMQRGAVAPNPDALPRANFPKQLVAVAGPEESKRLLAGLDPSEKALVPPGLAAITQDSNAAARITGYTADSYRIHYRAASDSLLRVSLPYFPGWQAQVDGSSRELLPVDHALTGVIVPAGERDLVLEYHSTYFGPGALISLLSLAVCAAILLMAYYRQRAPG